MYWPHGHQTYRSTTGLNPIQKGTFAQWKSVDAFVVKGSKGTTIMAPRPVTVTDKVTGEEESWMSWRVCWVFAASQVEGWERPEAPEVSMAELGESGRAFMAAARARFTIREHGAPSAYYDLVSDSISIPAPGHFEAGATGWAGVLLHELTH